MMSHSEVLFQRGSFKVTLEDSASPAVVDLVSSMTWGTPGKTQWKQMRTAHFLPRVIKPWWVTVQHGDKPLVTVALLHRIVHSDLGPVNSYYVRYLAFQESRQIEKTPRNRKAGPEKADPFARSPVRKALADLFGAPRRLQSGGEHPEKAVFYAFVELENTRSMAFCENFGFAPIRDFTMISFSRLFPRQSPQAGRISDGEKPELLARLAEQYQLYNFYTQGHIFHIGDYFVLREGGRIVAGLQAVSNHWQIRNLPGFSGKVTRKLLPRLPLISRLFNPDNFHLAMFEGIFVVPGHEPALVRLMESVLAELGLHTAFVWADTESELCKTMTSSGRLGLLNKLTSKTSAQVIARFEGFSEEEIAVFRNGPTYISAFDMA